MDRELASLRRGYHDEQYAMTRDAAPEPPAEDETNDEPGCAALDAVTRADALGFDHHDACDRDGEDPPLGVTDDLDELLDCWRCWYVVSRRRENGD